MGQVIIEKNENGLGKIILNRPETLNALNPNMFEKIKKTLIDWQKDDSIKVVLFSSSIDRAFSAGGDMKWVYDGQKAGKERKEINAFFELEYSIDEMVYTYEKPIVANLNGIVMGGGVGLTYGADFKIVTENTMWAMPEMNISFFPDIAASYFLNKSPGYSGRYVALTSKTYRASDVIYIGMANKFVKHQYLNDLLQSLESTKWNNHNLIEQLASVIDSYSSPVDEHSYLRKNINKINEHFAYETVEEIITSLQSDDSEFAQNTLKLMQILSPISLKVTLELFKRAKTKSYSECLQTDLIVADRFLDIDDFYEGVRSVLIDKDRNPSYKYKSIQSVPDDLVATFFK